MQIITRHHLVRLRFSSVLGVLAAVCCAITTTFLAGCSDTDAGLLSDQSVYATATACACGCYPYGSYPHTTPSVTPTPTGTWIAPTQIPSPTKTRPPAGCDYCTMPPAPTAEPPHWPPPIITCTPREVQPTFTVVPTIIVPIFPTLPPNTALPAMIGSSPPTCFGSMEGEALPGGIDTHPVTGRPYVIWSQFNPDPDQEDSGRVYLKFTDPKTGRWLPARTVNGPGNYRIEKGGPESAVGVSSDGTIYVVYARAQGDYAVLEWRSSTDNSQTWSTPETLPNPGRGSIYNVRLLVDHLNQPHIAAIAKRGSDCGNEVEGCGDIVYHERRPDGSWRSENRPLDSRGERRERQHNLAMTVIQLPDGNVRTVLGWSEKHTVFTSYKDGTGGEWQPPHFIIDGDTHPYGIQDYWPGWTGMQMLSFSYKGQEWVYFFWSLYSTGRICYVYSSDGGASWSSEDAMAYNENEHVATLELDPGNPGNPGDPGDPGDPDNLTGTGTDFVPPAVWGGAYEPIPFWDESHERIFIVYRFRSRGLDYPSGQYFPAYAYGRPGDIGRDWVGYESNTTEPLRLFPSNTTGSSKSLRGSGGSGSAQHAGSSGSGSGSGKSGKTGPAYLMWIEQTGSKEIYFAIFSPGTLLSGETVP